MSEKQPTKVDQLLASIKNNRIIAIVIVFAIVVIGLASFTDALSKLGKFVRPSSSTESPNAQPNKKPASFDDDTLAKVRSQTSVSLESVRPSPNQISITPQQTPSISAVVSYSIPDWVDSAEVSLRVNRDPEDGRFWHSM